MKPLLPDRCKGCNREIFWALSLADKPHPYEKARPEYRLEPMNGEWRAVPVSRFISHFETCPAREQFKPEKPEKPQAAFDLGET